MGQWLKRWNDNIFFKLQNSTTAVEITDWQLGAKNT